MADECREYGCMTMVPLHFCPTGKRVREVIEVCDKEWSKTAFVLSVCSGIVGFVAGVGVMAVWIWGK